MKKSQQHILAFFIFMAAILPEWACGIAAAWFIYRAYVNVKQGN